MMPLWISREYLTAAIIAATITATGNIIAMNLDAILWFLGFDGRTTSSTSRSFGSWAKRDANTVYEAESDGFVAAFTGGPNSAAIAELYIDVGHNASQLALRTRAPRYDGSVSPVPRGSYWRVRSGSLKEAITVWWLPVTLESTNR